MSKQNDPISRLAKTFHILGHQIRLRLVMALQDGELNVTELCRRLKKSQPAVSHHLRLLRLDKVLLARRNGKEVFYSINNRPLEGLARLPETLLRSLNLNVPTMRPPLEGLARYNKPQPLSPQANFE